MSTVFFILGLFFVAMSLFNLFGTSFNLPDMFKRFGSETVTLTTQQMPTHNHHVQISANAGTSFTPAGLRQNRSSTSAATRS